MVAQQGPIQEFHRKEWRFGELDKLLGEMVQRLRDRCASLEGNAIVGLEILLYPWEPEQGAWIKLTGLSCKLEDLSGFWGL